MVLYDNYLKYFNKTPNEQYREDVQAFVDESWDNNILIDKIILEDSPRTFSYEDNNIVEAYIDSVSEVSTNTAKIEGNYISVLFKDCYFQYNRGSMFYRPSNKNYYIVYQSTNDMRTMSKCKAIQCNNIIKWIDVDSKQIIAYPCSMGNELTSTTSQDLKFISTANGRMAVIVFGNEYTRKLELNQRIIFNGVPYRINAIKNYEENNFVDREVELLFLYLEKSSIEPTDDYIYNIANFKEYEYLVEVSQNEIKDIIGTKGTLTAQLTCNGEIVNGAKFKWISDDINVIQIDKYGNYEIVGEIGDTAKIKCLYIDDIYAEVEVEVVENVEDLVELKITPSDDSIEISKNTYQNFMFELYVNNEKQNDAVFTYIVNFVDNNYYTIIDNNDHNGIRVICHNATKQKLIITVNNNEYSISKQINIKLKGVW